ncbi:trypsin-like peptidase domain-containing protein [Comamonas sp. GB3 AK4-5]|uniref:trypsin-like peptidase domain-containing protein n=1 Tax=Comamonas sp. GB3 AK4-5 TaxID=3231487 RepID=UPI00351E39E7
MPLHRWLAVLCMAVALAGGMGCAPIQSWNASDFSVLARTWGPSVVNISVAPTDMPARSAVAGSSRVEEGSLGSGFIVSDDGYILTNAHVVASGSHIQVRLTDRREFKARLVGSDTVSDIALLKIEAQGLPAVRIGDPDATAVGDWALAIGSPFGFSNSVTAGIVSARNRVLPGADYMPFLQTDVAVNPGNSGGPLFNLRGEVIGINARLYSRSGGYQGLSFAIPIDVAMRIKHQLQERGVVTRGRIGIAVQEVGQALATSFRLPSPQGALVSYVQPRGAADRAGMRPGDVIVAVAGERIAHSAQALERIADLPPDEPAVLSLWRDAVPLSLTVLVERLEGMPMAQAAPEPAAPLGLRVRVLTGKERQLLRIEGGLLVQQINVTAARAGVMVGDLILALNGQPVATLEAMAELVRQADGAVALLVQRGGARLFVPIEIPR